MKKKFYRLYYFGILLKPCRATYQQLLRNFFFHLSLNRNCFVRKFCELKLFPRFKLSGIPAIFFEPFCNENEWVILYKVSLYKIHVAKVLTSFCCSKQAVFDGKRAIRGGIPFVFRKCLFCYILFIFSSIHFSTYLTIGRYQFHKYYNSISWSVSFVSRFKFIALFNVVYSVVQNV